MSGWYVVTVYRLLLLDKKGRLVGSETHECLEDQQAVAIAERKARTCEYVEVWRGGRPVCMCARPMTPRFRPWEFLRHWASTLLS
jgi:hypothetical protein